MTEEYYPSSSRRPWVYDGEPLEEPESQEEPKEKEQEKPYKTSPNQLKAIRKYEEAIKQDKTQLEWRNHQKNYSGAKSFITYGAKMHELEWMKGLIEGMIRWGRTVDNFDELSRAERKEIYKTSYNPYPDQNKQ